MKKLLSIDLNFNNVPRTIGTYLMETEAGLVLFESGPQSCTQTLKTQLGTLGYQLSDIKHVFITHIHLDHSAGAWELANNGAMIYAHEKGITHLHDPEKLIRSATRIYKDQMEALWGTVKGIPHERLRPLTDGDEIKLGESVVTAIETLGHAGHHHIYKIEDSIIAGDIAGVRLFETAGVVPPAPPPDLLIEPWQESIKKLKSLAPAKLCLTHFGTIEGNAAITKHLDDMSRTLDTLGAWMHETFPLAEAGRDKALAELTALLRGMIGNEAHIAAYETINPPEMTLMGVEYYYNKHIAR
ncbi:hypothetical protein COTS27_01209 [Spirochaetota bacterium]|nr:hypothetical protein COTS27_01209 [Spirochaetota bacterium]